MARYEVNEWFLWCHELYKHYKPSGESEEICDEDYMEKTDTDMG